MSAGFFKKKKKSACNDNVAPPVLLHIILGLKHHDFNCNYSPLTYKKLYLEIFLKIAHPSSLLKFTVHLPCSSNL